MSEKLDIDFLRHDTRAKVYLLWAALTMIGFTATHFYQNKNINGVWFGLSTIGLGYMFRVMPLHVKQMQHIFLAWLGPILFGMVVSGLVFYWDSPSAGFLISHLGAFWLVVMAAGYAFNGLVDEPAGWYWFAAGLNFLAGLVCFTLEPFETGQYLIAAIVSGWSMLYLWVFRTG